MATKKKKNPGRSALARGLARTRWEDPEQHQAAAESANEHKPWLKRRRWADLTEAEQQARIDAMLRGRGLKPT